MSSSRRMLFLYPEGTAPGSQTRLGRAALVLREQGEQVEELVIDDNYPLILDRLEQGMIPVVVKPDP